MFRARFLWGLLGGILVTLVALNSWGKYLQRNIVQASQPAIATAISRASATLPDDATDKLPRVWLPGKRSFAPDSWRVKALDGTDLTFAQLKGKAVFVNFWSTTCTPCIKEFPSIERLQKSLESKNVVFLAVTHDPRDTVRDFLARHHVGLPIYIADTLPEALDADAWPTTYIVTGNGETVLRQVGAVNWDTDAVRTFFRGLI
jgi:thiol-disulfide isomerase/thioredoxin